MTFLTVIFCIVAFFVLVLSIPLKVSIGYDDKISLSVKYLFIKLNILPTDPNKPKKEKKPKEEKPKEEKPKTEKTEAEKKPKRKMTVEEIVDMIIDAVRKYGPGAKMI